MNTRTLQGLFLVAAVILFITAYSMAFGHGYIERYIGIHQASGGFAIAGSIALVAVAILVKREGAL